MTSITYTKAPESEKIFMFRIMARIKGTFLDI